MLCHVRRLLVVAQGVHKLVLIDGARVVFVDQVEELAHFGCVITAACQKLQSTNTTQQ